VLGQGREASTDEHIESLLPTKSISSDIPVPMLCHTETGRLISGENSVLIANWLVLLGVITFFICLAAAIGKIATPSLRGDSVVGCTGWMLLNEEV
jgi:hypothetical protein